MNRYTASTLSLPERCVSGTKVLSALRFADGVFMLHYAMDMISVRLFGDMLLQGGTLRGFVPIIN